MGLWENTFGAVWDELSGNNERRRQEGLLNDGRAAGDATAGALQESVNNEANQSLGMNEAKFLALKDLIEQGLGSQSGMLDRDMQRLLSLIESNKNASADQLSVNNRRIQVIIQDIYDKATSQLRANRMDAERIGVDNRNREAAQLDANKVAVMNRLLMNQNQTITQLNENQRVALEQLGINRREQDAIMAENKAQMEGRLGQNLRDQQTQNTANRTEIAAQIARNREEQLGVANRGVADQINQILLGSNYYTDLANRQLGADAANQSRNITLGQNQGALDMAQSIGAQQGNLDATIAGMHGQNRAQLPLLQAQYSALSQALPAMQAVLGMDPVQMAELAQVNPDAFRRDLAGEMMQNLEPAQALMQRLAPNNAPAPTSLAGIQASMQANGGGQPISGGSVQAPNTATFESRPVGGASSTVTPSRSGTVDLSRYFGFNNPAYQLQLEEGQRALNNQMAARGRGDSSAAISAQTDLQRRLTADEFNNQYGRLQGMVNFGAGMAPIMHSAPQTGGIQNVNVAGLRSEAPRYLDYGTPIANTYERMGTIQGGRANEELDIMRNTGASNLANVQNSGNTAMNLLDNYGTGMANTVGAFGTGRLNLADRYGSNVMGARETYGTGSLNAVDSFGRGALAADTSYGTGRSALESNLSDVNTAAGRTYGTGMMDAMQDYGRETLGRETDFGKSMYDLITGAGNETYRLTGSTLQDKREAQKAWANEMARLTDLYYNARQGIFSNQASQNRAIMADRGNNYQNYLSAMAGVPQGGLMGGVNNVVSLLGAYQGFNNATRANRGTSTQPRSVDQNSRVRVEAY